jgi:hypothetical protein
MIDNRRTDDTATDNDHAILRFHDLSPLQVSNQSQDQSALAACPPIFAPATGTSPFPPIGAGAFGCPRRGRFNWHFAMLIL